MATKPARSTRSHYRRVATAPGPLQLAAFAMMLAFWYMTVNNCCNAPSNCYSGAHDDFQRMATFLYHWRNYYAMASMNWFRTSGTVAGTIVASFTILVAQPIPNTITRPTSAPCLRNARSGLYQIWPDVIDPTGFITLRSGGRIGSATRSVAPVWRGTGPETDWTRVGHPIEESCFLNSIPFRSPPHRSQVHTARLKENNADVVIKKWSARISNPLLTMISA